MTCCNPTSELTRRIPALKKTSGLALVFDPWDEGEMTFGPPPKGSESTPIRFGWINPNPTYDKTWARQHPWSGVTLEFDHVGRGDSIRDFAAVHRAPLAQFDVMRAAPSASVRGALIAAGETLRAVVIDALIGGVVADDGTRHVQIGGSDIAADPKTGAWRITSPDGGERSGRDLRRFAFGLKALSPGVFAVRLLEAIFRWRFPPDLARGVADLIDAKVPTGHPRG